MIIIRLVTQIAKFKKNGLMAASAILILLLLFFFVGCSFNNVFEKEYYIGQDSRWRNLNLGGKERNFAAFNNDLLSAIARKENFGIRIEVTPMSDLLPDLERGKLQGALINLQPSYIHESHLLFSEPYYLTGPVLIIPATAPLEGWNEKAKKIVGLEQRTHEQLDLEQDPSMQIKIYDDILTALADLRARKIDGAIFPVIPAYTYVTTFYSDELKIVTPPLTDEGVRLVALKSEAGETLINRFNQGLAALKAEGTYYKLLNLWDLIDVQEVVKNQ